MCDDGTGATVKEKCDGVSDGGREDVSADGTWVGDVGEVGAADDGGAGSANEREVGTPVDRELGTVVEEEADVVDEDGVGAAEEGGIETMDGGGMGVTTPKENTDLNGGTVATSTLLEGTGVEVGMIIMV